jgi:hypothetical protein
MKSKHMCNSSPTPSDPPKNAIVSAYGRFTSPNNTASPLRRDKNARRSAK